MFTPNQSIVHGGHFMKAPLCQRTPSFKVHIRLHISFRRNPRPSIICGAGFDPDAKTKKPSSGSSVAKNDLEDNPSQATKSTTELDDSEIEARLLQRRMRKKEKTQSEFQVDTDSGPDEQAIEFERNVVYVLFSLFSLIIINGIIIASSGFLPESVDQFIGTFLYPSFSPLVGVFLTGSVLYGVWKTQSEKKDSK